MLSWRGILPFKTLSLWNSLQLINQKGENRGYGVPNYGGVNTEGTFGTNRFSFWWEAYHIPSQLLWPQVTDTYYPCLDARQGQINQLFGPI